MEYNHEAIYKAYPDVETINDNEPIIDKNGNTITFCLLYTSDAADE